MELPGPESGCASKNAKCDNSALPLVAQLPLNYCGTLHNVTTGSRVARTNSVGGRLEVGILCGSRVRTLLDVTASLDCSS